MARTSWLWVALVAVTMVACSGGRQEDLSCDDLSPCRDGSRCIDGLCQDTSQVLAATAGSIGADVPVLIIDAAGNTCEAQACTNLQIGTQVTFRAGSAPGYRFTGWTGSPECVGSNPDLVVANLTHTTHCDANYVKRVKVAGHTSGAEGGVTATSDSPFAICNGGVCEVDEGKPVKLRADDRFGQRFTGWSGPGCGSATTFETTVNATGDLLCVANFVERIVVSATVMNAQGTIEVTSEGGVCEPGSCIVDKGGNAVLSAPLVPKFRFAGWSGTAGCVGSDPVLRFSALQQSETCLATYTPRVTVSGTSSGAEPPPPVTALSSDLYASCNGGACDTDVGGGVTLLASSAAGYRLTGWTGAQCEAEKGAAVMLTNVSTDTQCVATYLQGIAVIGAVVGAPGEVTASSTTEAAVCAEGGCVIDIGGNVTLTAPSPAGYRFLGWNGDEGCESSAAAISFPSVTQSKTCYARFAARYLVRGTSSPGEGGTVAATSSSAGAVCANDGCTLDGGGEVALTVTPRDGFRFSGWSGGGACTGTDTTVRVTNVQGNTTCQANFVGRFTVAGVAAPPNGGTISAASDSGAASCAGATCQIDRGSRVSLTAAPAEGFRFVGWSGCSSSTNTTLTLEGIAQDMACTASFTPLRYTVASTVAPVDSGSVAATAGAGNPQCGNGQCTVDWGSAVSLTAAPAVGWRFGGWSGCTTSDEPTITVPNVRTNVSCQARFVRITFTVTAGFTPNNGGNVAISASGPSATCNGLRCTVPYGGGAALTATPAQGWNFGGWSGCSTSMSTTLALNNVMANADCTANFTRQRFDVLGNANPTAGGGVAAASTAQGAVCNGNRCTVNFGSAVTLRATPTTGWRFINWTGCGTNANAELDVASVTAAVTCQANFERLRFTVSGTAGAGGAVAAASNGGDCSGSACTVNYGGAVNLTAVPATGFRFVGWTGGGVCAGTDPSLQVANVTANVSCGAAFQLLSFNVTGAANPAAGGTLTVPASNGASCNGTSCVVQYGGSVTYAAAPAAGYNLTGWTGCTATPNDATRAVVANVTAAASCTANFTLRSYRVAGAANEGGSITNATTTNGSCNGAVCTVNHGGNATFTAAVTAGYTFGGWSAGCTANAQNALQATVSNVTAAATCTASFTRQRFTVTGNTSGGGAVVAASEGGACTANSCTVNFGADVALMAVPATGFRFTGWSACPVSGGAGIVIGNVASNVSCTAAFERQTFTVTGAVAPAAGATMRVVTSGLSCTGLSCVVPYGSSITFEATDTAGYDFLSWTGCTPIQENPRRASIASVTATGTCTANYQRSSFGVQGNAGAGGAIVNPTTSAGSCNAANLCTVDYGGTVSFTASPNRGFVLSGWSGACTPTPQNPAIASWTGVTQAGSCTASFVPVYTVSAEPNGEGKVEARSTGVVCPSSGETQSCTVVSGSLVTLTASNGAGRFTGWTCNGVAAGATAAIEVRPTSAQRCIATFVTPPRVTVTALSEMSSTGLPLSAVSISGTVDGNAACSGGSCVVNQGSTVTLTTTNNYPATLYFAGWRANPNVAGAACPTIPIPTNPSNTITNTIVANGNYNCVANWDAIPQ